MRPLRTRWAIALAGSLLAVGISTAEERDAASPPSCELEAEDAVWLQRALDGWVLLTSEVLDISPEPLPWIVTFDEKCAWHLASPGDLPDGSRPLDTPLALRGEQVPVRALLHQGIITLPNGQPVPADPMAFASLSDEGQTTFFVLALSDIWHRDQQESQDLDLDDFFLGVASHEMVHTRQLVEINQRFEALEKICSLPEHVGDTTIEEHFAEDPEFAKALAAERSLLFEAAAADPNRRAALAAAALDHLRERRLHYFTGEVSCFGEVEDLLLSLEGTAVWAHYQLARLDSDITFLAERPGLVDRQELLKVLQAKEGEWVQDAGFALFLLLDDFVPTWRDRILGPELPSPVGLLDEALALRNAS